ncbi:hypothetical protein ANCCEY_01703 [Ancylostoma ceylanicum]|uniref:Uncharacterized protein n=1 Tax=Ancylostoma ceylanicum TaxID=53326 RepID=A0A0D6M9P8_9BILA|nr:hypothetical protein ANCCEY_01703 [Ancylostoma ceylanicum]
MHHRMHNMLVLVVELIGVVSLLFNCYAFYAFIGKSKQGLGSAIIPFVFASNVIFTISYTLEVPVPFVHNFCVVAVASGAISSGKTGVVLLVFRKRRLVVFFVKFVKGVEMSEYSFIYSSPKWMAIVIAVNILILIVWSYKYSWPATNFGEDIADAVLSVTGLNLKAHGYIGFCAETCCLAVLLQPPSVIKRHAPSASDLLAGGVLGDGLGSLGNCVLGEFSRKDEAYGGLDFARGDRRSLVVLGEARSLNSDTLKDVVHERVHDGHRLRRDTGVGVHLLQHTVDVDGVALLAALSPLLVSGAAGLLALGGLLRSLGRWLWWHDDRNH